MAALSPTIAPPESVTSRGGRDNQPPVRGGGDDGPGDRRRDDFASRLRRSRLAIVVAVVPILMLFVSFTSAYIVRQGLPTLDRSGMLLVHDWFPVPLPTRLFLINTAVLVASGVTLDQARRQFARRVALQPVHSIPGISMGASREFPWLALTIVLGFAFLVGQGMAWRRLAAEGFFVASSPSSSFVYLLTGAHAVHLFGGIVALLVVAAAVLCRRSLESPCILVDITAWYWHFMALLWIYILALLEFAG